MGCDVEILFPVKIKIRKIYWLNWKIIKDGGVSAWEEFPESIASSSNYLVCA